MRGSGTSVYGNEIAVGQRLREPVKSGHDTGLTQHGWCSTHRCHGAPRKGIRYPDMAEGAGDTLPAVVAGEGRVDNEREARHKEDEYEHGRCRRRKGAHGDRVHRDLQASPPADFGG